MRAQTFFNVKKTTRMEKVFNTYAQREGVKHFSLRFFLEGQRINGGSTPKSLGLKDQDQIECMREQQGGARTPKQRKPVQRTAPLQRYVLKAAAMAAEQVLAADAIEVLLAPNADPTPEQLDSAVKRAMRAGSDPSSAPLKNALDRLCEVEQRDVVLKANMLNAHFMLESARRRDGRLSADRKAADSGSKRMRARAAIKPFIRDLWAKLKRVVKVTVYLDLNMVSTSNRTRPTRGWMKKVEYRDGRIYYRPYINIHGKEISMARLFLLAQGKLPRSPNDVAGHQKEGDPSDLTSLSWQSIAENTSQFARSTGRPGGRRHGDSGIKCFAIITSTRTHQVEKARVSPSAVSLVARPARASAILVRLSTLRLVSMPTRRSYPGPPDVFADRDRQIVRRPRQSDDARQT